MSKDIELIAFQDFHWHDAAESGEYAYGKEGYLSMDGSNGQIRCHRFLKEKIVDSGGGIEVKMRVVFGKPYYIRLYDSAEQLVVDCLIDADGWVKFRNGDEYVNSGKYITLCLGEPGVDPEFNWAWWYAETSDEVAYSFAKFDFAKGTFEFTITEPGLHEKTTVHGYLARDARDISKLELATGVVEPGTIIHLRQYKQYKDGVVVDQEEFSHHWEPIPAPPDGYPRDNFYDTKLRPVANRWLETRSLYGWVKTHIPFAREGELQFDIMTPDVVLESCLQLQEYSGVAPGVSPISFGIYKGKFFCMLHENSHSSVLMKDFDKGKFVYFDEPVPVPDQVYTMKVGWYGAQGYFRLWIDEVPMKVNNSYDLPAYKMEYFQGVDTIYLHIGESAIRPTLVQKKQGKCFPEDAKPQVTYWGRFRIGD